MATEPMTKSADALTAIRLSHHYELARDRRKSGSDLTLVGVRSLFLLNGGAVVALFTVLGHADQVQVSSLGLWWAFAWFAAGNIAALLAVIVGLQSENLNWLAEDAQAELIYFEQVGPADEAAASRKNANGKAGNRLRGTAIALGGTSLAAFTIGSAVALLSVHVAAARKPADGQVAHPATAALGCGKPSHATPQPRQRHVKPPPAGR